jgi:titin
VFQDSGLNQGFIYTYRVRAVNAAGPSEPSGPAAITLALPPAPSDLTATPARRQINLSWESVATPDTGYQLERCAGENCLNFAPLANIRAGQTVCADKFIKLRRLYRYRARAINAAGVSAYSEIVAAQVNPLGLTQARVREAAGLSAWGRGSFPGNT